MCEGTPVSGIQNAYVQTQGEWVPAAEWKRTCGSGRWEHDLVVLVLKRFFLDFAELRTLQLGGAANLQRGSEGGGGGEHSG